MKWINVKEDKSELHIHFGMVEAVFKVKELTVEGNIVGSMITSITVRPKKQFTKLENIPDIDEAIQSTLYGYLEHLTSEFGEECMHAYVYSDIAEHIQEQLGNFHLVALNMVMNQYCRDTIGYGSLLEIDEELKKYKKTLDSEGNLVLKKKYR